MNDNRELVDRFLDETLNIGEAVDFVDWLRSNSDNAIYLAERAELHANLRRSLRRHAEQIDVEPQLDTTAGNGNGVVRWHRIWNSAYGVASNYITLSVVIATIVMTIIVLALGLIVPVERSGAPVQPSLEFVAVITDTHQSVWDRSSDGNLKNRSLFAGERVRLNGGLAEVTFADGAVVLLEGPTEFLIDSPAAGTIRQGKLTANVPPAAVGFRVDTPLAQIIDLGTEFCVFVHRDGTTDSTVLQGKIRLSQGTGEQHSVELIAGQSVHVGLSGEQVKVVASSNRIKFHREIPGRASTTSPKGTNVAAADNGGRVSSASPSVAPEYSPSLVIDSRELVEPRKAFRWIARDGWCSTTIREAHWAVEFQESFLLSSIEIQGRIDYGGTGPTDSEHDRHRTLEIELFDAEHKRIWSHVESQGKSFNDVTTKSDQPASFGRIVLTKEGLNLTNEQRRARYLRISQTTNVQLLLAEVRAFAETEATSQSE